VAVSNQASIGVAIGGGGGEGSSASTVDVENSGVLTTTGQGADGVRAESEGGSGGDGALTISGQAAWKKGYAVSVAVGGNGGTGNVGGNVTATSNASIKTTGDQAYGINAQSIGGGGGNALTTIAASIRTKAALKMSIGGVGGLGGDAGQVQVDNHKNITVTGAGSLGIYAESAGGGGGNSQSTSVGLSGTANNTTVELGVNVGLRGASGGDGGEVSVNNSGYITTGGAYASGASPAGVVATKEYGIYAESEGGDGGNGGSAFSLIPGVSAEGTRLAFSVNVGGEGGAGGVGKMVTVTNAGTVVTNDTESYGIYAQSVGGGGGTGGGAAAAPGVLYDKSSSLTGGLAVGGEGGKGNTSAPVSVDNTGSVKTLGDGSDGILAQSVGGGGGNGGSAYSYLIGIQKQNRTQATINLDVSVGGFGGTGGSGDAVSVMNSGFITTTGAGANGIEAQSIGGGGGRGGDASSLTLVPQSPFSTVNVNVGGFGGEGNDGGAVTVAEKKGAVITTTGAASAGIYAQSVGAGGGRGGVGAYAPVITLSVGGAGGANGDGGAVTVNGYGVITTEGSGTADGIFAQSVGGGGGQAGGVGFGIIDTPYSSPPSWIGTSVPMSSIANKSSGNGGAVSTTMTGSITTKGNDAIGIYAQSVGGGGGIRGQAADLASCPNPCTDLVGSLGNTGSAGSVKVDLFGSVTTGGQYSHGIFAQSAAGSASAAGNVAVGIETNSSVLANGANSDGILAQSVGGSNGSIEINVLTGAVVRGGSGESAGIHFLDGAANTLDNAGMITTLSGVNGVAVRSDGGLVDITNTGSIVGATRLNPGPGESAPETIANSGRIVGDVDVGDPGGLVIQGGTGSTFGSLTGGAITIRDGSLTFAGGNTALGDAIAVDGGAGTVTNDGRLMVTAPIALTGNFDQSRTGSLDLMLSSQSASARLSIAGAVSLAGDLQIDLASGFHLKAGDIFDLIGFDGALAGRFEALSLDGSACAAFGADDWRCGGNVLDLSMSRGLLDSVDLNVVSAVGPGAVPEPSTWVMLGVGFLGLGALAQRRRSNPRS
jgi:PEP-CTERM motif